MSNYNYLNNRQRITQKEKDANNKQWYKDQAELLDSHAFSENHFVGYGGITEYKRKKVNYDLFNNIINITDFEYVCQPFGAELGELPANLTNRDIVSSKIKVLLGMENEMPFSFKVFAVNEEATTRKEQEEFGQIKKFVVDEIMKPIRAEIEKQNIASSKGRELSPEEQQAIQKKINEQVQSRTPDEVRRYMMREHQDPAEVLGHQLLEYLIQEQKCKQKFSKGWKHSLLAGEEIYYVGVINGKPSMHVVNNLFFDYDKSPDLDYIEDGEWAVCEYRMTPSEVLSKFGSELNDEDIDKIYQFNQNNPSHIYNADFTFTTDKRHEPYTIRVLHCTWKGLKKVGFLTYLDTKTNSPELKLVDENYKLNKDIGDISIEWEWIPETHEVWKILHDIFAYARPVLGQYKDMDNLYECKLPYYGAAHDNLNSPVTAPMDRMKSYQYYYDIVLYRIELLMASDKGKILAANINKVPKSAGIDIAKFQYFMEANKIAWFNPNEEGNRGQQGDVTNFVKEIDLSLASDINQYIQIAEYIERKCGESVGITRQMEGQIQSQDAVSNTRQNIVQSSHILRPYFELHNDVKANVLKALLETSIAIYSVDTPKKLNYVLDDMSIRTLKVDPDVLSISKYGLFVGDSSKAYDAKKIVESLAQAAMQTQQADLIDIVKVVRSESIVEAEELLTTAQQKKAEQSQAAEQAKLKQMADAENRKEQLERDKWKHEENLVIMKEEERRKTEIEKQAMLSIGFNEDKDADNDGELDVLEIAKMGINAKIKAKEMELKQKQLSQKTEHDKAKIDLEHKKIKMQASRPSKS